jgi:hypothetical protein
MEKFSIFRLETSLIEAGKAFLGGENYSMQPQITAELNLQQIIREKE